VRCFFGSGAVSSKETGFCIVCELTEEGKIVSEESLSDESQRISKTFGNGLPTGAEEALFSSPECSHSFGQPAYD
jgi:hypothetical protein